jgi:spore germination protein KB
MLKRGLYDSHILEQNDSLGEIKMNKEIISDKQAVSLVILFTLGSSLIIGTSAEAKQDMWLSVIVALVLSIPILFIYAKILSMFPSKDLFDISILVFGKFFGNMINILYIWFSLHLGSIVLYTFGEFINIIGLPETPKLVPMACFIILCLWGVRGGIEILGRWSEIFLIILLLQLLTDSLLSIPNFRINNILPILEEGTKPVMIGAFTVFAFPFTETVVFASVFSSLKDEKSPYKAYTIGVLIPGILLTIIAVRNILVLGPYVLSLNYFASYVTASRIDVGRFIERLEALVSTGFLFAGFIKVSVCLLSATKGISKLFNFNNYRFIVIPSALIILNLSYIDYKDSMELIKWDNETFPYYAFIFEVILPVIIFVGANIKLHKTNSDNLIKRQ